MRNSESKGNLRLEEINLILIPVFEARCFWELLILSLCLQSVLYFDPRFRRGEERAVPPLRWQDEMRENLGTAVAQEWGLEAWPMTPALGLPQ